MQYIILFSLALVVYGAYHLYFSYRASFRKKIAQAIKETQDRVDTMQSQMTFVEYRGYKIPMTVLEKKELWDNMTRENRNKAFYAFKQALKKGQITEFN